MTYIYPPTDPKTPYEHKPCAQCGVEHLIAKRDEYCSIRCSKLGKPRPDIAGANNWRWRGDDVGYSGAHRRVEAAKGKAVGYACVGCGEPADHWSYGGEDHASREHNHSPDPDIYSPRFGPCHKKFDQSWPERDAQSGRFVAA